MSILDLPARPAHASALDALAQGVRRLAACASLDALRQETVGVAVALSGASHGRWAGAAEAAPAGAVSFTVRDAAGPAGIVILEGPGAHDCDPALLDVLATTASTTWASLAQREAIRRNRESQDRWTAELALKQNLLRTLVDHIPFRIYAKDRESRFIFGNNRMARLAGVATPAQLIGKTDFAFFPAELAQKYFADEQQVLDSGASLLDYEELVEDQDTGELGWTVTTKVLLRDEAGEVNGIVGIGYDVTQRKQLEARLLEQNQALELANARLETEKEQQQVLIRRLSEMQGQLLQSEKMASIGLLAAGVAHEINNPLAFISANFGALERDTRAVLRLVDAFEEVAAELPADVLAAVAAVREDIGLEDIRLDLGDLFTESLEGLQRVKNIVQNLKDFSRIGSTTKEWANLEEGLDSTLNVAWNEIKYKADVVKDYAGVPELLCLPSQLNQVFLNLLINAAHAIEGRGAITVRTGYDDASIWVEVEDTGSGIAPEHLDRIFEPFFTTKPVGKGTGLGLSIVYGIVQGHKGTIGVTSSVGHGTVFKVALPRSGDSAPRATP